MYVCGFTPPLSMLDGAKIQTNFQITTILAVHIVNNFRPTPLIFIKLSLLIRFLSAWQRIIQQMKLRS